MNVLAGVSRMCRRLRGQTRNNITAGGLKDRKIENGKLSSVVGLLLLKSSNFQLFREWNVTWPSCPEVVELSKYWKIEYFSNIFESSMIFTTSLILLYFLKLGILDYVAGGDQNASKRSETKNQ